MMNRYEAIRGVLMAAVSLGDARADEQDGETSVFEAMVADLTLDDLLVASRRYAELRREDVLYGRANVEDAVQTYNFHCARSARLAVMYGAERMSSPPPTSSDAIYAAAYGAEMSRILAPALACSRYTLESELHSRAHYVACVAVSAYRNAFSKAADALSRNA